MSTLFADLSEDVDDVTEDLEIEEITQFWSIVAKTFSNAKKVWPGVSFYEGCFQKLLNFELADPNELHKF